MQLIETIRVYKRQLENISFHNDRFNRSRRALFSNSDAMDLSDLLTLPDSLTDDVYKCRILYGKEINTVTFEPYHPKPVQRLSLVYDDQIDYSYKYADRTTLKGLLHKGSFDEILIVKNGLITDASYANCCFYDGLKWWTPAFPLLKGTRRASLLAGGLIQEAQIKVSDLPHFKAVKLINAMMVFEETRSIPIAHIIG